LKASEVVLVLLLLVTFLFTIYYWVDFYAIGGVRTLEADWYLRFEAAFPVADLFMAASALAAAVAIWRRKWYSRFFTTVAGSSLLFLALLDITFNTENGLYALTPSNSSMVLEAVINVYTLVLGLTLLGYSWRTIKTRR